MNILVHRASCKNIAFEGHITYKCALCKLSGAASIYKSPKAHKLVLFTNRTTQLLLLR